MDFSSGNSCFTPGYLEQKLQKAFNSKKPSIVASLWMQAPDLPPAIQYRQCVSVLTERIVLMGLSKL